MHIEDILDSLIIKFREELGDSSEPMNGDEIMKFTDWVRCYTQEHEGDQ